MSAMPGMTDITCNPSTITIKATDGFTTVRDNHTYLYHI